MVGRDNRVLLIGPGLASGYLSTTTYARALLESNGFTVVSLNPDASVDYEIQQALKMPIVVSIVRSVGTASETLLLLSKMQEINRTRTPQPAVICMVSAEHRDAHFARAAYEQFRLRVIDCIQFEHPEEEFGRKLLKALAGVVSARAAGSTTRESAEDVDFAADDQGRRALLRGSQPVAQPTGKGYGAVLLFVLIFLIIVACAALFAKEKIASIPLIIALFALVTVMLVLFVGIYFFDKRRMTETAFIRIIMAVVNSVSGVFRRPPESGGDEAPSNNEG